MRPSHGYVSSEGLLKSFPRFDVPTFFGRELEKCKRFAEVWYGSSLPPQIPVVGMSDPRADSRTLLHEQLAIIYPTDYMTQIQKKSQLKLIGDFVSDLERSLGVERKSVCFAHEWDMHSPLEAQGCSLTEFMELACLDSFFYEDYHNFVPFIRGYKGKYGKTPYFSPPVRWQWLVYPTLECCAFY